MDYRLIVLSSSGDPASFEAWTCASDAEAAERASAHRSAYGCELWQGERRIGVFAGPMSPRAQAARPGATA